MRRAVASLASLAAGLAIRPSQRHSGRGVFASERALAPGEEVLRERPFLLHVNPHRVSELCFCCSRRLPAAPANGGAAVRFCSATCASESAASCTASYLQSIETAGDATAVRGPKLFGELRYSRPLLAVARCGSQVLAELAARQASPTLARLGELVYGQLAVDSPEIPALRALYEDVARACAWHGSVQAHVLTFDWFVGTISRLRLNAIKIEHGLALDDAGVALFSLASMFNHSCEPNAALDFAAGDALVSVVVRAPVPRGAELTIAYAANDGGLVARREYLAEAYGFVCACDRCLREDTT